MFIAGILIGVFISTIGFSVVVRRNKGSDKRASDTQLLKLAHSLDQNHPVHKALAFMAGRLEEKSNGSVCVEIYPNEQLGSETDCIAQLRRGALAMVKTSTAPLESFLPEMAVFGVPYVFEGNEHCWKVLNGEIGKELLMAGERVGLRGLCFYDAGARSFYTVDKMMRSPEDLKGQKIRVQQSETAMNMVEALGGSPTPVPWGELYTALQQRMVDGAENNPPSFYSNRHFEVCKYFSLDEHTRVPDVLLISKNVWESMPAHVQQWVQEAADESSVHQRELWQTRTEEALTKVQLRGVEVLKPDKTRFVERVKQMHQGYEGTPVGDLMKRIGEVK